MMAHLITREDWEEYVREEAMELGEKRGRKKGRKEGKQEAKRETASKMLEQGIAVELIATVTGLSENEILQLK